MEITYRGETYHASDYPSLVDTLDSLTGPISRAIGALEITVAPTGGTVRDRVTVPVHETGTGQQVVLTDRARYSDRDQGTAVDWSTLLTVIPRVSDHE